MNQRTLYFLDEFRHRAHLKQDDIYVLDWGCGKGQEVLALRKLRYTAFGVDVDSDSVQKGAKLLRESGFGDERCIVLTSTGLATHEDLMFHFTYSNQVLEHVQNMETVANELYRVMRRGAEGIHIFPAQKRLIEAHLFMPCIHWLPKNGLRKLLIFGFVTLGIEPRWRELEGLPVKRKTNAYFAYSRDCTYYRNYKQVQRTFENAGFSVELTAIQHPRLLQSRIGSQLIRFPWIKSLTSFLLNTFRTVELRIRKA